jgi:hypothetical protein
MLNDLDKWAFWLSVVGNIVMLAAIIVAIVVVLALVF